MWPLKSKAVLFAAACFFPTSNVNEGSDQLPCCPDSSLAEHLIRFIADGLAELRDAPEGNPVANLYGNSSVRFLSEQPEWARIVMYGWVQRRYCISVLVDSMTTIERECNLTDDPGMETWGGYFGGVTIARLLAGGSFRTMSKREENYRISLEGWVRTRSLRPGPDEQYVPEECATLLIEASEDSTRVRGSVKLSKAITGATFRIRLYDYCGNRIGPQREFEVNRLEEGLGSLDALPFDVKLPVERSCVATCRIAVGEGAWGWR